MSTNKGNNNRGSYNHGSNNTGNYNFGNANKGNDNNGSYNKGNDNQGNYNTGNDNHGSFNTLTTEWDGGFYLFDKPATRKSNHHLILVENWDTMTHDEKRFILTLENFDPAIFEECTGITLTDEDYMVMI